jgi:hypothetical protein
MIASTEIIKRNRVASKGLVYNDGVIFAAIVLVFLVCGSPAQAYGPLIEEGKTMFMVSGNSYYNGGEGEELAETLLTFLFAFTCDDEDYHRQDHCWDEELGIRVPKSQLGIGVNHFLSPNLAIGGRYLYRQDSRDNDISRLWGGGPEVVYFMGGEYETLRPFVGASFLLTKGIARETGEELESGTSVNLKGGVNVAASENAGLVFQVGYQNDHMPTLYGNSLISKTVGIGIGFTVFVN